jgi:hypothetical protein
MNKEKQQIEDLSSDIIDDGTGIEIEQTEGEGIINEPFDPTLIRVETKPITIDLLMSRIKQNEINLMPDFQRKAGIWSNDAKSRLIESILIRIPLPAFYMDATDDDHWLVVDGLQRLTTLNMFVLEKKLKLSGLEFLTQLETKTYDDLPRNFQRRIKETQVTVYLIEKGTPSTVKFNIFKRINTGGLPLSPQEIRHALNQGKSTVLLKKLAESNIFKQATNNSIRDERMGDRECVLRFFAFTLTPYTQYKVKDFDGFLSDTMSDINKMNDKKLSDLEDGFNKTMKAAQDILGLNAFRKIYNDKPLRSPINKPLFECWTVGLNKLNDKELSALVKKKDVLISKFKDLMDNSDFESSISQSTGNIKKIQTRFSKIQNLIKEVAS